jgi:hypothetical protein
MFNRKLVPVPEWNRLIHGEACAEAFRHPSFEELTRRLQQLFDICASGLLKRSNYSSRLLEDFRAPLINHLAQRAIEAAAAAATATSRAKVCLLLGGKSPCRGRGRERFRNLTSDFRLNSEVRRTPTPNGEPGTVNGER